MHDHVEAGKQKVYARFQVTRRDLADYASAQMERFGFKSGVLDKNDNASPPDADFAVTFTHGKGGSRVTSVTALNRAAGNKLFNVLADKTYTTSEKINGRIY